MQVQFTHPSAGTVSAEVPPEGMVVGRHGGGADLELNGDGLTSRRHGRLWIQDGAVHYEDLGSSNGSWLGDRRLAEPVRLEEGVRIRLGQTLLSLPGTPEPADLLRGMTVVLKSGTDRVEVAEALQQASRQRSHAGRLYDFVQEILHSADRDRFGRALRRLYEVVPAAQRIALVAWPPGPDGSIRHLVPPEELEQEGVRGGPISTSLAGHAVETGQALLLSDAQRPQDLQVGASVAHLGIRSAVYVPLVADGEVLGLLCVDSPTPAMPLVQQDFMFIRAVGGLLASALHAERLREEARRRDLEAREVEARREAMVSFLKIASHDLKNPIAVIKGCSMALEGEDDEELREELRTMIADSSARAEELIFAYLEVSALESGQALQVDRRTLDPLEMIDQEIRFISRARDDLETSGLRFANRATCRQVSADPQKLRQILSNLVSNAVKYSPEGGEVAVHCDEVGEEVVFQVRDQGVGISTEDQERLFQEFQRVGDRSVAAGTGLGLWLTAALVQAHGGRIWVESTEGEGSTFSFALPKE